MDEQQERAARELIAIADQLSQNSTWSREDVAELLRRTLVGPAEPFRMIGGDALDELGGAMDEIKVRAWSDPKPRSAWRYAVVVLAGVLAGWWAWRSGFAEGAWWGAARVLITAGAASTAWLAVNVVVGRPFR